jgi:hypothetical protein
MTTLPLILAEASLTFKSPTGVDALLRGPQQTMLLRRLERHVPAINGSRALWEQVTSIVDGSLREATPEHRQEEIANTMERLRTVLARLQAHKQKRDVDPFVHDALHLVAKLLRTARWRLMHPKERTGAIEFRFPRAASRLRLLLAAERFHARSETADDKALLKRACGNAPGLREIAGTPPGTFGFESPTAFCLITPYRVMTFTKDRVTTSKDFQTIVANES